MKFLLKSIGFILSKLPESFLNGLCKFVGFIIYAFPTRRVLVAFSNVDHCFPDMPKKQQNQIVKESCQRMVEMALFVVTSPFLSKDYLKKRVVISDYVLAELEKNAKNPRPTVLLIPHFAMMETITMFPLITNIPTPRTGVFYRPFDNESLESWVKESRERFGIELLSRKEGLIKTLDFLKENGCLAVLFDQNAGNSGTNALFFDRPASTSELPGIFIERQKADCAIFWAKRTGFWQSEVHGMRLDVEKTVEEVTIAANDWLEEKLKDDETARFDWLWLHRRWRVENNRYKILSVPNRKSILDYSMKKRGVTQIPRKNRILITSPSNLNDTIALLPLLRTLRESRFDSTITMLCPQSFSTIISKMGVVDSVISAPENNENLLKRFAFFKRLRESYPDVHLVFSDSIRDDIDAWITAAPMRLAIQSSRKRILMHDVYKPDAVQSSEHIALEFEGFLRRFGMKGDVSYQPIKSPKKLSRNNLVVGIAYGFDGENPLSPSKWGELAKRIDDEFESAKFKVFGFGNDSFAAMEIIKTAGDIDIESCVAISKNNLVDALAECDIVIGADSPMLHISNAIGARVLAIYGKTNPIRNGLVFDSPKKIVQPSGCPPQGGMDVEYISVENTANEVVKLLVQL